MTGRHFRAIADAVADLRVDDKTRVAIAEAMADTLRAFNGNFKRQRFLDRCFNSGGKP